MTFRFFNARICTLAATVMMTCASQALAAPSACPDQFSGGQAPDIQNQQLLNRALEICYGEFGVLHSGLTRTPLWSAEYLTHERVLAARAIEREDDFFAETGIPADERAELSDYAGSGYDRGHLVPAADMSSEEWQRESFSLANIIPQTPENNRVLWRDIESIARDFAVENGEVYVVTGPVFLGERLEALQGRVIIPSHVFKAIYVPATNQAGAYIASNTSEPEWQTVSVADLAGLIGMDVFPAVAAEVKATPMSLPSP